MKAIIHIGGEKTGTTTVQNFAARNRARLAAHGVLYPLSLGSPNQLKMTGFAAADHKLDDIRIDLGLRSPDAVHEFRGQLRRDLGNEIQEYNDISTILVSNEHLQSRLVGLGEVMRLKRFMDEFTNSQRIIVYLRRQDRVAVSHYSTKLKAGNIGDAGVFPFIDPDQHLPPYYDYNSLLKRYEKVFGHDSITVRIFEPRRLLKGELLVDFRDACGFPADWNLIDVPRTNESLSEVGIQFFRRFNELVPRFIDGLPNPARDESIIRTITKRYHGAGPMVSRDEAEGFYRSFEASNRAVAERYFLPGHHSLFDEDFDSYDRQVSRRVSPTDLVDLGVYLWQERSDKMREAQLEIALLQYKSSFMRGRRVPPAIARIAALAGAVPPAMLLKFVGALLHANALVSAIDVSRSLLRETDGRIHFILAIGVAYWLMGDEEKLAELKMEHASQRLIAQNLSELMERLPPPSDSVEALQQLKEISAFADFYLKAIGWIYLDD